MTQGLWERFFGLGLKDSDKQRSVAAPRPRIYLRGGLWYCTSQTKTGAGFTPAMAYVNWLDRY